MRRVLVCLLIVFSASIPACITRVSYWTTTRIVSPDPILSSSSSAAKHNAILNSMKSLSWAVIQDSPGVVHAGLNVRGIHEAYVAISYDDNAVSLKYENSKNLNYVKKWHGREYIHRNYLAWVSELWWQIRRELSFDSNKTTAVNPS